MLYVIGLSSFQNLRTRSFIFSFIAVYIFQPGIKIDTYVINFLYIDDFL